MATTLLAPRLLLRAAINSYTATPVFHRTITTVPNSPHIHIHPDPDSSSTHLLSLLPSPPSRKTRTLCIATTTAVPPTTASTTSNADFIVLLNSILAEHATHDPVVQASAAAFASNAGSTLGSGGALFAQQTSAPKRRMGGSTFSERMKEKRAKEQAEHAQQAQAPPPPTPSGAGGGAGQGGAGGANYQGGMGGAGRGGWIHVNDQRLPPDFGRIPYPEDIFGSLEVDGEGNFVGEKGNWQSSGTYRIITRDGVLGLSPYLRSKVVERLRELEKEMERR